MQPAENVKAGVVEGNFFDKDGIQTIADIPSRDVLIAKFMGSIQSPVSKAVRTFQAIADAKQAAQRNGFTDAHFTTAKAEIWLPKWLQKGNRADVAIIDPPRKGCDRKLLDALVDARIPRILYISCNPATLARDLAPLSKHYTIGPVQPVDLFPQTSHVETIVLLQRETL